MRIDELDFTYPESLVATERAPTSRVLLTRAPFQYQELKDGLHELLNFFEQGDVLVINDTKVLARRVFSESGLEILFLGSNSDQTEWSVLCPSSRWKDGTSQTLPGGVTLELTARGRPQTVKASLPLTPEYFEANGDLPLPPYIQKARDERKNRAKDKTAYQTAWAEKPGSLAAPTASLHFSKEYLASLRERGVKVVQVTLHVGLGTFLPVTTDTLEDHVMHAELAEIPKDTWQTIIEAKARGHHIWALGTTVTRTLESAAGGLLAPVEQDVACEYVIEDSTAAFFGETKLFIQPGYQYKIVDRLLTNFHQPRSTLLALVAAFAGLASVKSAYGWAIDLGFRLFSYGDLSVWFKADVPEWEAGPVPDQGKR
jgi:S-adenosylmethionine:tRNA ribosyltransferase-isomerase